MTTFVDGPARGQTLMLRRGVIFLRVVYDTQTKLWDALNEPDDKATATEIVYAYVLRGESIMVHVNIAGNKGGMFQMAEYKFIEPQPKDSQIRVNKCWEIWVDSNKHLAPESYRQASKP